MAPMNRLWGALGLAGWGPRAPRDAPEHKVKKVQKRSLFWMRNSMAFWHIGVILGSGKRIDRPPDPWNCGAYLNLPFNGREAPLERGMSPCPVT